MDFRATFHKIFIDYVGFLYQLRSKCLVYKVDGLMSDEAMLQKVNDLQLKTLNKTHTKTQHQLEPSAVCDIMVEDSYWTLS